ncbi:MAG TPA: sugar transferase [Miltoncostaea sp.]|nr:sugar transferase [Miltoncostaea sp.]
MGSNPLAAPPPDAYARQTGAHASRASAGSVTRLSALITWDALAPVAALAVAVRVTGSPSPFGDRAAGVPLVALVLAVCAVASLAAVGAYAGGTRAIGGLAVASGACALVASYSAARLGWDIGPDALLLAFLAAPLAWLLGRVLLRAAAGRQRVLLVGSGPVACRVAELATRHRGANLEVVGCIDDAPSGVPGAPAWRGAVADLDGVLAGGDVDRVIVAFTRQRDEELAAVIRSCDRYGVEVDVVPRLFDLMPTTPRAYDVGELSLLRLGGGRPGLASRAGKRAFDIVAAVILLLVFAPVMAVCAIAIVAGSGFPVLFRQERIGRDGRPFRILKFRTMVTDADAIGLARIAGLAEGGMDIGEAVAALKPRRDARITPVGGFMRRTSLDELPQLWNVLRGDMSIVGPRPLRDFECDALADWELRRQGMRPGITGLWQVTSRSDADWAERMRLDYRYVRHWSLGGDARILARTVTAVMSRKGAV